MHGVYETSSQSGWLARMRAGFFCDYWKLFLFEKKEREQLSLPSWFEKVKAFTGKNLSKFEWIYGKSLIKITNHKNCNTQKHFCLQSESFPHQNFWFKRHICAIWPATGLYGHSVCTNTLQTVTSSPVYLMGRSINGGSKKWILVGSASELLCGSRVWSFSEISLKLLKPFAPMQPQTTSPLAFLKLLVRNSF